MNIVIVRTDYKKKKKKKTNLNKAMRIQFESIPRDLFGLISIVGIGIPHEHSDSAYRLQKKKKN